MDMMLTGECVLEDIYSLVPGSNNPTLNKLFHKIYKSSNILIITIVLFILANKIKTITASFICRKCYVSIYKMFLSVTDFEYMDV